MVNKIKIVSLILFISITAYSQDSVHITSGNPSSIKKYEDVIKKNTHTRRGLFTVHEVEGKYYFEIPDSLFNKEMLIVTRISQGASGTKLYTGDESYTAVIKFEKGIGDKIFLRKELYGTYIGDSSASTYRAINRSNFLPIVAAFPVEARNPDLTATVINVTDLLLSDNDFVSLNPYQKKDNYIINISPDKCFISQIQSFPANVEITTSKTYVKKILFTNDLISIELNTSIILLPSRPLQQRFADKRVGYFSVQQTDFESNPDGARLRKFITRWRLEPRNEDVAKYKEGELVEPQKQIVFYIDPATPKKWIPYLIQGVNDWEIAFEQAGFKNAIQAKKAPTYSEDSTWSINDARHSAIVYKPSEIENASGPSVFDPRSGEILESHINFYHNIIHLVHDWYTVQCGAVDPNAAKMVFDDSLIGKLIRVIISHEVGHALGLTHNFRSSSTIPVEKLRDKNWVEANGFCPSIMDYARFNYVAQPEDSISEKGLFPRIGSYDKWAIDWGYRYFPEYKTPESEMYYINNWIIKKLKDKTLSFGSEHNFGDPRIQTEDIGDNSMLASAYGIKNLKRILPKLREWTEGSSEGYESLNQLYTALQDQLYTYLRHVINNIGGIYEGVKRPEEPGPIYEPEPVALQKDAMLFLENNFLNTPRWLLDTAILNRTGQTPLGVLGGLQQKVFVSFFFPPVKLFGMLSRNESEFGIAKTYTVFQMLQDLKYAIFSEVYKKTPIDLYRRTLQTEYIIWVKEAYKSSNYSNSSFELPISGVTNLGSIETAAIISGYLKELQKDIKDALPLLRDKPTIYHLQYLYDQIQILWKN
jgi:hypothetical protein